MITGLVTLRQRSTESDPEPVFTSRRHLADEKESGRFTKDVRQLGWLIERLLIIEPQAAADVLLRVGAELHAINPDITRAQREITNRWHTPIAQVLARLGHIGRKRFMRALVHQDVALARTAIEVFAQHYAPPPAWFRALLQDRSLHPKLKETVRANLFFHTRSHGSEPWQSLLD